MSAKLPPDFDENKSQASMPRRYEHIDRVDLWIMAQREYHTRCYEIMQAQASSEFDEALVSSEAIKEMKLGVAIDSAYIRGAREQHSRNFAAMQAKVMRIENAMEALHRILIKIDWNADDFEGNQYQETRSIIFEAFEILKGR